MPGAHNCRTLYIHGVLEPVESGVRSDLIGVRNPPLMRVSVNSYQQIVKLINAAGWIADAYYINIEGVVSIKKAILFFVK